jgi:hypothetical protein
MQSKLTLIEEKLQLLSILSNGNSIIKFEDIIKGRKLKVSITDSVSSIKAISLDTTIPNTILKGKITTDNTKPILGIAVDNSLANSDNDIVTNGVITDNSLTGGTIGQAVYINNSGSLSLAISGLKIGRLLSIASPIKVWINPGREYDELQEFLILERSLYFALRYLSYYLPFVKLYEYLPTQIRGYGNGNLGKLNSVAPTPTDGGIVFSDVLGLFVAVITSSNPFVNKVYSSVDGTTWTPRSILDGNSWRSVAYGNGIFCAVSSDGTNRIATSPDGINWTTILAPQNNYWNSITFGAGLFVAISFDGANRVMTSPDGVSWTLRNASEASGWRSVIFDGTDFYCCAGIGTNRIMKSADGINWSSLPGKPTMFGWIAFGNKTFITSATDGYYLSYDNCATWKKTLHDVAGVELVFNQVDGIFYSKIGYERSSEL